MELSGDLNEVRLFLEKCSTAPNETIESLQCISKSKNLIQWIRTKSSGIHKFYKCTNKLNHDIYLDVYEMEKFISVALDTIAGEGDEVQDRLSDLSVLCGKFSILIYDIDGAKADLKSLMDLFSRTLTNLKGVHDLLKIVVSSTSQFTCSSNVLTFRLLAIPICNGTKHKVNCKVLLRKVL